MMVEKPSFANFITVLNILKNATENTANPGPDKKDPITLNKPCTKALPFSGSKAESKESDKVVAIPTRLVKRGPKVILPNFSAKLVTETVNSFIFARRVSFN